MCENKAGDVTRSSKDDLFVFSQVLYFPFVLPVPESFFCYKANDRSEQPKKVTAGKTDKQGKRYQCAKVIFSSKAGLRRIFFKMVIC